MPKTQFSQYDKQRMIDLADRIESFVLRYRALADKIGDLTIELPNQRTLESAIVDLRTHAGRAELKIEEVLDDIKHNSLGKAIAAEAKDLYQKTKKKPKP